MSDNDLRAAALSALYALENLERDTPSERWFYTSTLTRLKHALGRRETAPGEQLDWADLTAIAEEDDQ